MLLIEVSRIPPEGMDVEAPLDAGQIHVDGEAAFALGPGGSVACHVEKGDDETVHVQGHLSARLGLECGRCLGSFSLPLEQDLDLFYLPHRADQGVEDEEEIGERDLVVAYYREGRLDLGEMVREQLFLALPMKRLCREDCRGLCPSCGVDRNSTRCDCPAPDTAVARFPRLFDKGPSS
jgi:uncharacterized metal-binding protein YceD (DUF177 family)